MSWTTPADIKAQVQKLWNRGLLLAPLAGGTSVFPRRLQFKGPDSRELSERFAEVRDWIAQLSAAAGPYRIEWRRVNHRVLGANDFPAAIWIDQLSDALGLIGKRRAADQFVRLVELTTERQPELVAWLARRPLRALELAQDWTCLLDIVAWLRRHPRPGIYLRQVDIPGVRSKFIEAHRTLLAELLDLVLPEDAIAAAHTGIGGFCRRYGFLDKPVRQRFRILDPELALLRSGTDQDITVTHATFARLSLPVERVFVTENEINFLAFPPVRRSLVLFGGGYGFETLAAADWLRDRSIHYWGDLDTHGFAILNQLRAYFPQTTSLLMDRTTLLAHKPYWDSEPQPETRDLKRLSPEEKTLYDDLRHNRLGDRVRLEQEKIGFNQLVDALKKLP